VSGGTRTISADCHVNEPPWVFDRVPKHLADRTPRLLRGADGGDGWSFDGGPPKRTFGIEATAGRTADGKLQGLRFDEIMPGNYDGAAHARDMDVDGIDVSVVYPGAAIFVYIEPDRELGLACLRSYNDWVLEEFQGAAPARIVGLPMLPVDDGMDVCGAELERVVALGARGAFIPGFPARPYHDPYYDPLWKSAVDAGVPLTFHRTFGGKPDEKDWNELVSQNVTAGGTAYRFFSAVRPFTYMTFGGVFERFPKLKIVGGEVNFGWVPFWAQTMDQQYDNEWYRATGGIGIDRPPSELLGENLFVTVLDDDIGFRMLAGSLYPRLADCAMFSTDYPHSVCLWPRAQEHVARLTDGLDDDVKHRVLAGNAARVYGV
jgi:predicted TIM-barrel fold metal-dependent hydrolase